jgi:D-glycero-D-manno-heptose 1,7-bisphosphate phosphatase
MTEPIIPMKSFFDSYNFDKNWCVFLDRDGVINNRFKDDVVDTPEKFKFIDGVKESIAYFSEVFKRIIVVTNQQGIGKGIFTEQDLEEIHSKMISEINREGGRIDKIYHCPALKGQNNFYRKPLPGMALLAKKDFPEIDFRKSFMVGDALSDMRFGKNMKMITVFIGTDRKIVSEHHTLIDYAFESLFEFKVFLEKQTIDSQNSR